MPRGKVLFFLALALILPLSYHWLLTFFYTVVIAETPLLNLPWVAEQVRTGGLGLDALFCGIMILITTPIYLWYRRSDPTPRPAPRLSGKLVVYAIVISLGIGAIIMGVNMITQKLLLADPDNASAVQEFTDTFATAPTLDQWFWNFLSIAVLGPIVEEIIFRGVLYNGIRMVRGGFVPVIISSIYFGLWHSSPVQIAYTMVLGVTFALVYYATNSLWLVIIMHVVNNSLAALPPGWDNDTVALVVIGLKVILLPVALWLLWRMVKTARTETALSPSGAVAVR